MLLVVHSNAKLFAPLLCSRAARPVRACLLVDAALLVASGATPVAPPELLDVLRAKASADGLLPAVRSKWWNEDDVVPLFPRAPAWP